MSGKYVRLKYSEKYGWWLAHGRETFYDEDRYMRSWETPEDALAWLEDNHPELILIETDEPPKRKPSDNQMDLGI